MNTSRELRASSRMQPIAFADSESLIGAPGVTIAASFGGDERAGVLSDPHRHPATPTSTNAITPRTHRDYLAFPANVGYPSRDV
jgi:hypothetical protein